MTWTYALLALVLLVLNGFFVGAEFALIAARRTKLESLEAQGNTRARVAMKSVRELSFMLAAAQLGVTMASLGLGAVAEPAVAHLIETGLSSVVELPEGVLHTISFLVALAIVVYLHMVVGEMAPKNVAIAQPEQTALQLAIPMRLYANLFRPFVRLLNALANGILRALRVEPVDEVEAAHTAEEIGAMVVESAREGMLGKFEERLLSGAIGFGDRDAGAAMVPRTEVTAVPLQATPAEVERVVVESGHTRVPVYRGDLDDVVGFFHAKDLLRVAPEDRDRPLSRDLVRPMLVVPESRNLQELLLDMRRERVHFALVVEEHGGTAGVVTIEDLLEELVGEIRDEHDVSELGVEVLGRDRYVVPGGLRIDEAADRLGVELPEGEYETVAGFLMDRLGRIPKRRDAIEHGPWRLRVRAMHRRRVVQVVIEPRARELDDARS